MADEAGVRLRARRRRAAALWGDSDRIIQTLTNLLGNAIKFSPPDTTVIVERDATARSFVFWCADQGRGVPEPRSSRRSSSASVRWTPRTRATKAAPASAWPSAGASSRHTAAGSGRKRTPPGSRFQFTIPLAVRSATPASDRPLTHSRTPMWVWGTRFRSAEGTPFSSWKTMSTSRASARCLAGRRRRDLHAAGGRAAVELRNARPA